ncbi:MAG TPA: malectin domain-containing carbohydrate-binding protein [Polyangia bacterium]|nr:malectin domain-containing carbohydrate-binding protein [Polyangia bacterium]
MTSATSVRVVIGTVAAKWKAHAVGAFACLAIVAAAGCEGAPAGDGGSIERVSAAVTSGATKINAGGPAASPYIADVDFSGGSTVTRANAIDLSAVDSPAPTAVYQSQRYGNFTYTLPGFTKGAYNQIRLHFCDTHWTTAGSRTFNVVINGTTVLSSFDIIKTVGAGNKALTQTFTMPANSSGQYVIAFTTVKDAATVSGIEVTAIPTATSTYAADCVAGGVPLPPNWGSADVGSGKAWTDNQIYTDTFLEEQQGHIYFATTSSPAGLCVINAHGFDGSTGLFDVICQGTSSGKACFWEGTQNPSPLPHDVGLVGGAWTVGGGASPVITGIAANPHPGDLGCTNCHAGKNVFINHFAPNHPLNLSTVAGWMPSTSWYIPVDDPVLPQNSGPDTFVEYPASTSGCLTCHSPSGPAGPFPRLSTPGYLSAAGETYCAVLQAATDRPWDQGSGGLQGGMPPVSSNKCSPGVDCAAEKDPFVLAMLDTCNGVAVSRANSPFVFSSSTGDHAVIDKWVSGSRQVWQLDDNFSGGAFHGWNGSDQSFLESDYRATGFLRNGNASDLVIAATDTSGVIWEIPDTNPVTQNSPVLAIGGPSGYRRHDGANAIDYRGQDDLIYEGVWDGVSQWNITQLPGQTLSATGDPRGYRRSGQSSAVIYACDSQLCEERLTSTGWHFRAFETAVRRAPFVPTPLATSDGKFVTFYVGEDGLRQIVDTCDPDPSFTCKPTESVVYANQNIVSAPAAYVDQSGGVSVVVITDSNGSNSSQVVQLSRAKNGTTWTATTLYTAAKSTETLVGDPAAYLSIPINANTIVFRNAAFKTYELQWSASQNKYVQTTLAF